MSDLKVCPNCETDEALYSVERAAIMYPIRVPANNLHEYTGDNYITLDEGTVFEDDLYCRGCDNGMTISDLIDEPKENDDV